MKIRDLVVPASLRKPPAKPGEGTKARSAKDAPADMLAWVDQRTGPSR